MTLGCLAKRLTEFQGLWKRHSQTRLAIPYWRTRWHNAFCVPTNPEGTRERKLNSHSILASKDLRQRQINLQRQAKRWGVKNRRMSHFLLPSKTEGTCVVTGYGRPTCQCGDQLNWFDAIAGRRVVTVLSAPCSIQICNKKPAWRRNKVVLQLSIIAVFVMQIVF